MNPVTVALASATSWGTSDFLGGISSRRITPNQTVAIAHALSLCAMALLILSLHLGLPSPSTLRLGLIAGFFGGGGLVLFYQALSLGSMGLTAAIAGVLTAAIPVLYGLASQGLPAPHRLLGFVVATAAIWLIAAAPSATRPQPRTLFYGALSGACFGIYFVLLKLAGGHGTALSGLVWAMTGSRITSTALACVLCSVAWRKQTSSRSQWTARAILVAAAVGLLDTGGNLLYMLATRVGRLDIAAMLSSLYPAVTILLAAWFLKERTTRTQTIGMVLALGSVALIAA